MTFEDAKGFQKLGTHSYNRHVRILELVVPSDPCLDRPPRPTNQENLTRPILENPYQATSGSFARESLYPSTINYRMIDVTKLS